MQLVYGIIGHQSYGELIEHNKHVVGWKTKCLSLACRITLVRLASNNLPVFQMQVTLLPA